MPCWQKIPIGELLKKSDSWIELDPTEQYKEVTVRLWGKGVVLRREVSGPEIASKRRLQVKTGQFILSRIDARNGAFGLIPPELDGAVVSNDFPVFEINQSKLLPDFLGWLSRTHNFVDFCLRASEGTTNRVRLKEKNFLATDIMIPQLAEQQRIVAKIEQLAAKVEKAQKLREQTIAAVGKLLNNALKTIFCPLESDTPLGEVLQLKRGYDLPKQVRIPGEYPVFAANGEIDRHCEAKVKGPGVVTGRSGSVGAVNFVNEDFWPLNTALYVRDFKGNDPRLVYYLLLAVSDKLREISLHTAVPTLDRKRAHTQIFVKVPLKQEQPHIVAYLDNLQTKIDSLKQFQTQTQTELDALLPSILDKAFKGEL